jgi:predicted RNA-binding protein associated with RNAse of E/G family
MEWFSPDLPFNAFAVYSPSGQLRGWYANVAYPTRLDDRQTPPLLIWHDLYLDLIGLPDGTSTWRDEDELRDSGLQSRDLAIYQRVVHASAELTRRFQRGLPPFEINARRA